MWYVPRIAALQISLKISERSTVLQRRSQGNHSIIKLAALILTSLMVFGEFVEQDPVVGLTLGQFCWKG